MPTLRVHVPATAIKGGLSAPRIAKNMLARALKDEVNVLKHEKPESGEWTTVYVSDAQLAALQSAADRDGLSLSAWTESALVRMGRQEIKRSERINDAKASKKKSPFNLREDQMTLFYHVLDAASRKECLMAQAGTGIGKTRAMFAAALEMIASKKSQRVVLTFPSIQTIAHAASELDILCRGTSYNPKTVIMLGSGQFVSERRLVEFLKAKNGLPQAELDALTDWIAKGGVPIGVASKRIARWIDVSFLIDDAAKLAPSLGRAGLGSIALSADEAGEQDVKDDRGAAAYRYPKSEADDADLIICTHSMIGCHLLVAGREDSTGSILPEFDSLMVDEAHLLEANVAQALTRTVSLHMLRVRLNTMSAPSSRKDAANRLNELETICRDWMTEEDTQSLLLLSSNDGEERFKQLKELAKELQKKIKNALRRTGTADSGIDLRLMQRDASTMSSMAHHKTPVFMACTPMEKKWRVSVGVGPASVRIKLRDFFAKLQSASFFSASLAVPDRNGRWNYSYMQSTLGIPGGRVTMMPPVEHEWGYATPKVYCTTQTQLCRPRAGSTDQQTVEELDNYFQRMAVFINEKILPDAVGGTLILVTGYQMANAIGSSLNSILEAGRPMLVQDRAGATVQSMREQFIALARQGERPVWIATGTAWTGLDLRDSDITDEHADKDIVITDLVIPAVQTNISRGSTYAARSRTKINLNHLAAETFFATMQGMGRLVRREGLSNRRLWLLDPRIWDTDKKRERWLMPLRRYIEKFPDREGV